MKDFPYIKIIESSLSYTLDQLLNKEGMLS